MLVPSGVRGPGSFLIVYLWEYKHGNGWGPLYHITKQTCVFCIPFYSTNYAHATHTV